MKRSSTWFSQRPWPSAADVVWRPAMARVVTRVIAQVGLAAFVICMGATAGAQGRPRATSSVSGDQALERAVSELDRAQGAEVYAALRGVWETWNRADPARVEEALQLAARGKELSPAGRAYAGTLAAYARLRRGDTAQARKSLEQLGYVSRFLVIGPFDNEGKGGLTQNQGPELEFAQPLLTSKAYTGKERPVRWRAVPDAFPYAFVDLGALLRPETKVCGLLATFVSSTTTSKAPRKISAWFGSGGAYRVFWNGVEVYTEESYSRHDFDRAAVPLTLESGPNLLVVKVCGDEQAPTFSLRLAEPDGSPAQGLSNSNDLALAEAAAELAKQALAAHDKTEKSGKKAAVKPAPRAQGPLPAFERLTDRANASAADLEAHARYLVATDGDDPSQHLARDLSRRAADKEPTIRRLLLASRLAEDRNQASEWLEKAEKLAAASGKPDLDLLLARAWHRRHGPNFREALPLFQKALAIDPTNVEALRGTLELYNLAGLSRTALAEIERASEQNPNSVGLLALLASQLRTLGRTTDAMEVEARYHGLRADDTGYLNQMLELSLERNDRTSALHFADRLLQAEPHDAWVLGTAARAYRRLGEPDRALSTHRAALALAPEDVGSLRAMSDLQGELGNRGEQLSLLRELVRVRPQDKQVREYIENMEPEKPRADEAHAYGPDKFLYLRHAPAAGQSRRTLRDLTVSTVYQNGLSSQFRQVVFQPLTDAAAAQDRQYAFAYEASQQVVQLRGAKVYRKNGKVDEAIEWGEGPADDPSIAMYTSARTFYVQFPRL
ncbi:MAG TPA: tetratricopeptide repeat protein, partial [Polyangiaceae bacterium]|nr:tetratricopeptide repeat protein [Polyangiaceae bacterium]